MVKFSDLWQMIGCSEMMHTSKVLGVQVAGSLVFALN